MRWNWYNNKLILYINLSVVELFFDPIIERSLYYSMFRNIKTVKKFRQFWQSCCQSDLDNFTVCSNSNIELDERDRNHNGFNVYSLSIRVQTIYQVSFFWKRLITNTMHATVTFNLIDAINLFLFIASSHHFLWKFLYLLVCQGEW